MNALTILSTAIRQLDGLYSLNDLHKAAIAAGQVRRARTKEPGKFLASPHIVELIAEIETTQNPGSNPGSATQNLGNTTVRIVQGNRSDGLAQGTYVCKELVYAYAMWISAKFHLAVIRAFDALQAELESHSNPVPFMIPGQRYLVVVNNDGRGYSATRLQHDCFVMTDREFVQAINSNGIWVDTPTMIELLRAATQQLSKRFSFAHAGGKG